MSNFKKLSAYVDVPCEWVSSSAPRNYKLDQLKAENARLLKLLEDMKNAPCCGDYCWMELPQRLRDAGIEASS